jgi:preprotein translocase SecE subunit
MAVAVKNEADVGKSEPALGLAGASLLGALYLSFGFVAVYHLVPLAYDWFLTWWSANVTDAIHLGSFVYQGMRLVVAVAAAGALVLLWPRLFSPRPGFYAGAAIGVASLVLGLVAVYLVCWLAQWFVLAGMDPVSNYWAGVGIAGATGVAWLALMISTFGKPAFQTRLRELEEQGWFTFKAYKKGQGLRARRGTMVGILLLAGAGLWVYGLRYTLNLSTKWGIVLPFDPHGFVSILYAPGLTLSVAIAVASVWFAYRLVNYPRFADFLIATDAELNKVSWTTRKRLIQDTIVVLTTVVLMAVFLVVVDYLWVRLLTAIRVLQFGP